VLFVGVGTVTVPVNVGDASWSFGGQSGDSWRSGGATEVACQLNLALAIRNVFCRCSFSYVLLQEKQAQTVQKMLLLPHCVFNI
jgi:hypothetical protein